MPETLENKLENTIPNDGIQPTLPTAKNDLESKIEAENPGKKKPGLLKKMAVDFLKFSPWMALNIGVSAAIGAWYSPLLTSTGLTLGRAIANKKSGIKNTYEELKRLAKIGVFGGTFALGLYTVPDIIHPSTATLGDRLTRLAIFDGLMVPAFLGYYKTFDYITKKYGTKETAKSFYNFKFPKYWWEAQRKEVIPKIIPSSIETALTLAPIHYLAFTYVANPGLRLAIGTGNDILLALILGEKGLLKSLKEKFSRKKQAPIYNLPNTNPQQNYTQQYQNPSIPYKKAS